MGSRGGILPVSRHYKKIDRLIFKATNSKDLSLTRPQLNRFEFMLGVIRNHTFRPPCLPRGQLHLVIKIDSRTRDTGSTQYTLIHFLSALIDEHCQRRGQQSIEIFTRCDKLRDLLRIFYDFRSDRINRGFYSPFVKVPTRVLSPMAPRVLLMMRKGPA